MDIIITIPKKTNANLLMEEINSTEDKTMVKNIRVFTIPKKLKVGENCHIIHQGRYIGFMEVIGIGMKEFICAHTNKHMKGTFIELSGGLKIGHIYDRLKFTQMKGFQGFRYISNWLIDNKYASIVAKNLNREDTSNNVYPIERVH